MKYSARPKPNFTRSKEPYDEPEAVRAFVDHLKRNGCGRCGYNKCLEALEFHHVTGIKTANVSSLKRVRQIREELHRCEFEVLCANCHREEHHKD